MKKLNSDPSKAREPNLKNLDDNLLWKSIQFKKEDFSHKEDKRFKRYPKVEKLENQLTGQRFKRHYWFINVIIIISILVICFSYIITIEAPNKNHHKAVLQLEHPNF